MFKEPVFEDHCETFKSKGKVRDKRDILTAVRDYIEFLHFQTENYCYCSYYLCNELSVTSKTPNIYGDKIFLIVIFLPFGIN